MPTERRYNQERPKQIIAPWMKGVLASDHRTKEVFIQLTSVIMNGFSLLPVPQIGQSSFFFFLD